MSESKDDGSRLPCDHKDGQRLATLFQPRPRRSKTSQRAPSSMSKRLLDIVVAGGALIVTAPLFLVAALGIWLTSPGPIFYRAKRIGRDLRRSPLDTRASADLVERRRQDGYRGREFTMYKFRTMRVDSSHDSSPITAASDSR